MRTDHARRAEIVRTLQACGGDVNAAAAKLGVTRQWVYRVAQQQMGALPRSVPKRVGAGTPRPQ